MCPHVHTMDYDSTMSSSRENPVQHTMRSVLSVQSHVAHGYVGNKAATFPLQFLGWDVDTINTVNFSNHTGYGSVRGNSITATDMAAIFKGLSEIRCTHDAIILGYIPSAELIDVLAYNVNCIKTENPDLLYICDPVMGDQGHLYVDDSCVEAYKRLLLTGKVDIITPNQFELELLCGFEIESQDTLLEAVTRVTKTYNVKHVVVSSLCGAIINESGVSDSLYCAVFSAEECRLVLFKIPVIESYFTGVGDLFTALLLDKFCSNKDNISRAVNQVLTIMADVLHLTHTLGIEDYCRQNKISAADINDKNILKSKMNDGDSMRFFELRIIESKRFYGYDQDGIFKPLLI